MKAFCVLKSEGEKGRRRRGEQRKGRGQEVTLERARMAERFGGGAAPTGHQHAGTDRHQAQRGSGEPKGLRRAQKAHNGEVRGERQGSREPREKRGTGRAQSSRGSDARPPPGAAAKSPLRPALPARGSGAKGERGRSGAGEYAKSRSPVLVFCSRGPTPAESTGNGGVSSAELLGSPLSGKKGYGNSPLPGARRQRARAPHGPAGLRESGAGGAGPPGSLSLPLQRPRSAPPRPRGSPSS